MKKRKQKINKINFAYVLVISFYLVFAPIYANAILPAAIAVAGSTALRTVITKSGGAVVRTLSPAAVKKAVVAAIGICKTNPSFCTSTAITAAITAMAKDGIDITVNNNTTNNDIDVDIYRDTSSDGICYYVILPIIANVPEQKILKPTPTQACKAITGLSYGIPKKDIYTYKEYLSNDNKYCHQKVTREAYNFVHEYDSLSSFIGQEKCDIVNSRTNVSEDEIYNYFIKNASDDDITNIYNYDYSQHPNITINNKTESGDTINNNIKNNYSNEKETTEDVAKKAKDKEDDYHPDNINEENCSKNSKGQLNKCGKDKEYESDKCPSGYVKYNGNCVKKDDDDKIQCKNGSVKIGNSCVKPDDDDNDKDDDAPEPDKPKKCPSGYIKVNDKCEKPDDDDDDPPDAPKCPSGTVKIGGVCVKPDSDDDLDELIDCEKSAFHKKICDWIDWTQEEHDPESETSVDVEEGELPDIDTDKVDFSDTCPAPKQVSVTVAGQTETDEMSYQPLCDFFGMLKPFVIGMGWVSGAFIIAGRRG